MRQQIQAQFGIELETQPNFITLVGLRLVEQNNNKFSDLICIIRTLSAGDYATEVYRITTTPGRSILRNFKKYNSRGAATLKEGFYKHSHIIRKHRGQYYAICQSKPMWVYRDANRDDIIDYSPVTLTEETPGINIHKAGKSGTRETINDFSAGCQVFANTADFDRMMVLANIAAKSGQKYFSYGLVPPEQVISFQNLISKSITTPLPRRQPPIPDHPTGEDRDRAVDRPSAVVKPTTSTRSSNLLFHSEVSRDLKSFKEFL